MTDIPGTTTIKKLDAPQKLDESINMQTVVNVSSIKRAKAKPTELTLDNLDFRNWLIYATILTSIFVIALSLTSYKFLLLLFSGPGIGVMSFSLKESVRRHLKDNDVFIRRY